MVCEKSQGSRDRWALLGGTKQFESGGTAGEMGGLVWGGGSQENQIPKEKAADFR